MILSQSIGFKYNWHYYKNKIIIINQLRSKKLFMNTIHFDLRLQAFSHPYSLFNHSRQSWISSNAQPSLKKVCICTEDSRNHLASNCPNQAENTLIPIRVHLFIPQTYPLHQQITSLASFMIKHPSVSKLLSWRSLLFQLIFLKEFTQNYALA